jgi:hypothetical protein
MAFAHSRKHWQLPQQQQQQQQQQQLVQLQCQRLAMEKVLGFVLETGTAVVCQQNAGAFAKYICSLCMLTCWR